MSESYVAKQYGYEQPIVAVVVPLTMLSLVVMFVATGDAAGYWWLMVVSLIVVAALLLMPLRVEVTADRVRLHLAWAWRRTIAMSDIASVEAREYHALRKFGGWGWRFGADGARAYTVKGNEAAVISLRDGREVYVGARDTQALAEAIRAHLSM